MRQLWIGFVGFVIGVTLASAAAETWTWPPALSAGVADTSVTITNSFDCAYARRVVREGLAAIARNSCPAEAGIR